MTEDMGSIFLAEREEPIHHVRLGSYAMAGILWAAAIILASYLLTHRTGSRSVAVSVFAGVVFFLMGLLPLTRGLGTVPLRMREGGVENLSTGPLMRAFVPYDRIRFATVSTTGSYAQVTFHYRRKLWGAMTDTMGLYGKDMQTVGLQDIIDFLTSKGLRAGHEYELSNLEQEVDW